MATYTKPTTPKPVACNEDERSQRVSSFIKQVWFLVFYFLLLLIIASFGTIAET